MNDATLKPCPFCGGTNIEIQISTPDREGVPTNLMCSDCGASGPWEYEQGNSHAKADDAWNQRAALQSQSKSDLTLFCDLKTDEEKSAFFLSGRGYETGVIAQAIQNDVAMAYHRCAEYRKKLEALQAECEELRKDAERYRWLRDANINTLPYDDHGIGPEFPCGDDLDATIDSAMATETMRKQMES